MKPFLLSFLGISILACGSSSSNQSQLTKNNGPRPDTQSVAAQSTVSCKGSPLVKEWRLYEPIRDVVTVSENCLFEEYACDQLGYINSEALTSVGIVKVEIVYSGLQGSYCLPPGSYSCAYDTRNSAYQELHLACH